MDRVCLQNKSYKPSIMDSSNQDNHSIKSNILLIFNISRKHKIWTWSLNLTIIAETAQT